MYHFLPVGSEILERNIPSWNNWNMTHDEMEVSFVAYFTEDTGRPSGPRLLSFAEVPRKEK